MEKIVKIYKKQGETSLQCLLRFKKENPQYANEPISYAGRLDPMAEGLIIGVIGDENKAREKYLHLNKVYQFEMLFGFSTDTYDILGLVEQYKAYETIDLKVIENTLTSFVGPIVQKYPLYSVKSTTLKGEEEFGKKKSMFTWAREGRANDIVIPERHTEVFSLSLTDSYNISSKDLKENILSRIKFVEGDFRQGAIRDTWEETFSKIAQDNFLIAKVEAHCASGTYVRTITHDLGTKLGIPTLAYSIKRISVGDFRID